MEFQEYFQQKKQDENEELKNLPYTEEQLREIYRQHWEWENSIPDLEMSLEPQPLDYDIVQYYLPEKWEMPRAGKLLYSDEELQRVLKLIVFNLGVRKCLDIIPRDLIERYLSES